MDPDERKRHLARARYRRKRRRRLLDQRVSDSESESEAHESSDDSSSSTAASIHEAADENAVVEVDQNDMQLAGAEDINQQENNIREDANHAEQEIIDAPDQNLQSEEESGEEEGEEEEEEEDDDDNGEDVEVPNELGANESSESDVDNSEDERHYPSEDSDVGADDSANSAVEEDTGEEAESSDEEDHDDINGNQPIYPGAPITLHESLLAIFTLLSVEHLTGKLVGIILKLIALHCPAGSILKKTLYAFKKYFAKIGGSKIVYHYYCNNCIYPLQSKETICPKCRKRNASYFLELPLQKQLEHMFRRPNFYQDLQYRFNPNRKRHQNNLEDIYDGQIYQEQMVNNGFLSVESNVSFMWYSDGVQVFKSSSFSIWPLCLAINELPYKKRVQPENLLLVGLWFGRHKPSPNIFLKPLYKTMKKFSSEGHTFKLHNNVDVLIKGKILCGVCDLPAKCKFLQFKQYNGAFGCSYCLSPGGRAQAGKTTVQVYPYQANVQLRTHDETQHFARQALIARATDKTASVNGVKGPTLLSKLVPDIIRSSAIDIMHGVFLGICRLQTNLFFSSTYSGQPWSLHHLENVIDEKLQTIKPPSYVQRTPRLLKDLKMWKASEFKLFMMYYSVLVLKGVMDDVYLKHHCLLVSAISLLSQDSISHAQLESAKTLLLSYVNDYARLYSLRYLGINIHQLIHLPNVVLDLGPLWVYSCFFFESFNGKLNRLYHGTQHIALQVCSSVSMFMTISVLTDGLDPRSKAYEFCKYVSNPSKRFKLADQIDEKTFAVGTYSKSNNQIQNVREVFRRTLGIVGGSCNIFHRLKKSGVMYNSKSYPVSSERRESSFVSININGNMQLAQILRFVRWSDCGLLCNQYCRDCPVSYYAIIQIYQRSLWFIHDMPGVRISYTSKVEKTNNITAVSVNFISSLCFYFKMNDCEYISTPINSLEVE